MIAHCNCLWIGTNIGSILRLPVPLITSTDVGNNSTSTNHGKSNIKVTTKNQIKWIKSNEFIFSILSISDIVMITLSAICFDCILIFTTY